MSWWRYMKLSVEVSGEKELEMAKSMRFCLGSGRLSGISTM